MCAMRILMDEDGKTLTGSLTKIARSSLPEVCGKGFNEKTVKVRLGGDLYFVFREDLQL